MTLPPTLFLNAIEEFNHQQFFECHETLEDLWRPLSPSVEKTFYQGIIQIAVGLHHLQHGNLTGARNLLSAGLEKLNTLDPQCPDAAWIDLSRLIGEIRRVLENLQAEPLLPFPQIYLKTTIPSQE